MSENRRFNRWALIAALLYGAGGFATTGLAGDRLVLDSFAYPSARTTATAWMARDQARPARPAIPPGGGTVFPLPFTRDVERAYWDRDISADLSRFTAFELDLSCKRPAAVRALYLYLRSGAGWYVAHRSLESVDRQRLTFTKGDFQTEGKPAGWGRIDRIRISPWKGAALDTELVAHRLTAVRNGILLVKATTSAPDKTERAYAARILRRVSGWLFDMHIAHGVLTDDELSDQALSSARVVVLCYNPHPPARAIAALRRFVRRGGKLIVFYSASEELAGLMGLKLGPYLRTEKPGRWSAISFANPETWDVPGTVRQESGNIRPVFPATGGRVIAYWENDRGQKSGDPAWVASDPGLWMTHVLLEGDAPGKKRMLLGLLGRFDPSVWRTAAERAVRESGRVGPYRTLDEVGAAVSAGETSRHVDALMRRAQALNHRMNTLASAGKYPEAVDLARAKRETLLEVYSRIQRPRPGEFRAVWEHDGVGWYPGDWARTCRTLADSGMTAIFPNMLWGGLAHYPSTVLPRSFTFERYGDQLSQCVGAAHESGLEVHVWKVCWNLQGAPPAFFDKMKKAGRLQVSDQGKTLPWLCPSHPDNIALALDSLAEVVKSYPVDGVHLDYIRFPGANACYCATSRAAYERWSGKPVRDWPGAVRAGGKLAGSYRRFRTDQINLFVRAVHKQVRPLRPGLVISAAVFGNYPRCIESVGQDWLAWLQEGTVDFVCPMNYTSGTEAFATMCAGQLGLRKGKGTVMPGIGVTSNESDLSPDQVIDQIRALRRAGAPGFVLFDLSETLRDETLPALRRGITRP